MYLNSVTLVGFVGADPEQRQAKASSAKFTVFSVATQRSWKNARVSGLPRPSGTVSRFSGRGCPSSPSPRSARARTF
jgi:hypothetical protein